MANIPMKTLKLHGLDQVYEFVDPEAVAPSGLVSLKSYPIASEDELNSVFDQRLSLMASHSHEYFITNSSVSALLGGSRTLWHLYKYTADYATAEAIYYSTHGCCKLTKLKYGGTWQPLEWENPPMLLGVEYRTTERWNGKAIYTKLVDCGAMPNNAAKNINIGINQKNIVGYQAIISDGNSEGIAYNNLMVNTSFAIEGRICISNNNINMYTNANLSFCTAKCLIKYVKD